MMQDDDVMLHQMLPLLSSALPEVRTHAAKCIGDALGSCADASDLFSSPEQSTADRVLELLASCDWRTRAASAGIFYYARLCAS